VYKYGLWLFLFSVPQQDENNELVASETDAYAIADFINVSPSLFPSE
jgi:ATP-dependent Clp protease protease subunit